MNVWGKIIGTVTGYALDGGIGALVGMVAGHCVDMYTAWAEAHAPVAGARAKQAGEERRNAGSRYTFTLCVVTLGAKLAKIDGAVSKAEIAAFKEVFRVPPEELHNVGTMFDRARASSHGYESYAQQLSQMFGADHGTLDEVISCLFHVALADGPMQAAETNYIRRVSKIFGFSDSYFQRRMEEQVSSHSSNYSQNSSSNGQQRQQPRGNEMLADPYSLLGVPSSSTDQEIKLKYRKLVRENHPDSMVAAGKSKKEVDQATAKLARINAAYDQILKERQI